MSWLERAEEQLQQHATALRVIEGLAKIVKHTLGHPGADAIATLQIVERLIDLLVHSFEGKVSKAEIEDQIKRMLERRQSRDEKFDQELERKFRGEGA